MKKIIVLFLILGTIIFSNCANNAKSTKSDDGNLKYTIDDIPEKYIEANNGFSINLFRTLNTEGGDKNIFISPVSASFALGMTMNGADGNTFDEMKSTLGFNDLDLDEINNTYAALIEELNDASDGVEFNLANSIWYKDCLTVQDTFINANEDFFGAKIEALDFSDKTNCKNTVNQWVEDQTESKIKNFTNENDFDSIMLLINAIYYNASWKYQFLENETEEKSFYTEENGSVLCDMMSQKNNLKFSFAEDYQSLELPYANENYSMILIQPEGESVNEFINSLTRKKIEKIVDSMKRDSINISVPKLELVYEKELSKILKSMGMIEAFNQIKAQFPNMFNELEAGIFIKLVRQKSFISVNEEGTEAAAATVVVMDLRSSGSEKENEEKYMTFDRPFIFFILEKRSNSILFCGKIINPSLGE